MSVHWLNSISRTPRGVPTFEDATVVVAVVATAAASIIAAPGLGGVAGAGLACLMVAIAAVDARRFIIPDEFSAAALALGLVDAAIRQPDAIGAALAGAALRAAVTAGLFFGLWAAYRRLRGRDGIGLGDVKLAGVAGAWLDWPSIPIAVEIAALAALAVCLVRWLGFGPHHPRDHPAAVRPVPRAGDLDRLARREDGAADFFGEGPRLAHGWVEGMAAARHRSDGSVRFDRPETGCRGRTTALPRENWHGQVCTADLRRSRSGNERHRRDGRGRGRRHGDDRELRRS